MSAERSDKSQDDQAKPSAGALQSTNGANDVARMIASSKQIAQMSEPTPLTPAQLNARKLIHSTMSDRKTLESYREIRTRLLQAANGFNQIVMISSVMPESGTTHITANLAAAFALDETKTALLIDCNLHEARLHELFDIGQQEGLTDYLRGEVLGLDSIIYSTGIPRLRLIPAGTQLATASEYFTSLRMRAFLDVVKNRYPDRYIFIDGPSTHSADARILSELCDMTVLVVPYGEAKEADVDAAIDVVGETKVVGVVFNHISS
ncbi:MAG: hypothetical protein V4629_01510 [Pseudomonadota bacterium]